MPVHDDPAIPDDEVALRRVLHRNDQLVWDGNVGRWRPSEAAFRDPGGTGEVSVYLEGFLRAGETAADVAALRPGSVAFGFAVADARVLGFGVTHRPDQDAGPLGHAHGSVNDRPGWKKPDFVSARNHLIRQMFLASGEVTLERTA